MFYVEQNFLSHALELADALIGASAISHEIPLLAGNEKHYRMLSGLELLKFTQYRKEHLLCQMARSHRAGARARLTNLQKFLALKWRWHPRQLCQKFSIQKRTPNPRWAEGFLPSGTKNQQIK